MAKKTTTGSTTGTSTPKAPARTTAAAPAQGVKQASRTEKSEHVNITYEMVAERAYEIWRSQGGSDFDNWIRAERELRTSTTAAN